MYKQTLLVKISLHNIIVRRICNLAPSTQKMSEKENQCLSVVITKDNSGVRSILASNKEGLHAFHTHSDRLIVKDFKFTLLMLHSFIYKQGELWRKEGIYISSPRFTPLSKTRVTKAKNDLPEERVSPY